MKNLWLVWIWIAALFFLNASARAQTAHQINYNDPNDPYYQISDVYVDPATTAQEPLTSSKLEIAHKNFHNQMLQLQALKDINFQKDDQSALSISPMTPVGGIAGYAIAQLLFKAWDLVLQSKPVVNMSVKNASALPVMADYHWSMLTGWKPERVVRSKLVIKNLLGMKPVTMDYAVRLMFGGGMKGRGQYIASARIVPSNVKVLAGYNLDVSVNVPDVVNVGREDDPNAQVTLELTYKIQSHIGQFNIKKMEVTEVYKLQGDGYFYNKNTGEVYFQPVNHIPAPPLPPASPTPTPSPSNDDGILPTEPATDPNDPFGGVNNGSGKPTPSPKPGQKPSPTPAKVKPTPTPTPTPRPVFRKP